MTTPSRQGFTDPVYGDPEGDHLALKTERHLQTAVPGADPGAHGGGKNGRGLTLIDVDPWRVRPRRDRCRYQGRYACPSELRNRISLATMCANQGP